MTFIGTNICLVCKELEIPVKQLNTYIYDDETPVSLYDSDEVDVLLNLARDYLKAYGAWITIPGFYRGRWGEYKITVIRGKELRYLDIPGGRDYAVSLDLFTFMRAKYPKVPRFYDIMYTMAYLNKYPLEKFLDTFAKIW